MNETQPLELEVKDSFLLVLDSRNATAFDNGSLHSQTTFEFDDCIQKPKDCYKFTASVVSFACPYSFYLINYTNNAFVITIDAVKYTITIPNGNYTAETFMTVLLSLLPAGFTMTINNSTNVFTLKNTLSQNFIIGAATTCYDVLGLTLYTAAYSSNYAITFPHSCNFAGLGNLNIHLQEMKTRNYDSFNKAQSTIICSVPVNAPVGGFIFFERKIPFEFEVRQDVLEDLTIELRDDLMSLLDLNNKHFNITIQFNFYRLIRPKQMLSTLYSIYDNFDIENIVDNET